MRSLRHLWQRLYAFSADKSEAVGQGGSPTRSGRPKRRQLFVDHLEDRTLLSTASLPPICTLAHNPGYSQQGWQQIQAGCQQIRNLIALQQTPRPPTPQQPARPQQPQVTEQQLRQENFREALALLQRTRPGRNGGYAISYNRPPIYQGGSFTPAARPYTVSRFEAARVIQSLVNNGNRITAISPW